MGAPQREILVRLCTLGGILSIGQPGIGFGKLFRANYRSKLSQKTNPEINQTLGSQRRPDLKNVRLWVNKSNKGPKGSYFEQIIGRNWVKKLVLKSLSKTNPLGAKGDQTLEMSDCEWKNRTRDLHATTGGSADCLRGVWGGTFRTGLLHGGSTAGNPTPTLVTFGSIFAERIGPGLDFASHFRANYPSRMY